MKKFAENKKNIQEILRLSKQWCKNFEKIQKFPHKNYGKNTEISTKKSQKNDGK